MTEETANTKEDTSEKTSISKELKDPRISNSHEPSGVLDTEKKQESIEETEKTNSKEDASKKKAEEMPKKGEDNTIFIGIKPFMNYVTGVVMQFQQKGQTEVLVSARGKFISKAVDVVEVARRTFLKNENVRVKGIKISSEDFENKEGKRIYVSAIEITLTKE